MKKINEEITIGYKWLKDDLCSTNGNEPPWVIGRWKNTVNVQLCKSGYHACKDPLSSLQYIYGSHFVMVEARGDIIHGDNKFVSSEMRVIQELPVIEIFIEFAIACAKNCLFRFEEKYPGDPRPRMAIESAERYITLPAASDAADAAYATACAASDAAFNAACAASDSARAAYATAGAACAARVAFNAAYAAAYAARAAADAAASDATSVARVDSRKNERRWQAKKLEKIIEKYKGV